ncbi:hypothetical protein BZB76_0907 [Actinomadura pelletieri DSM 43383]|uniref:Uncharacterized protein n=1 Tax=Actinomadura pelletieri DSM 43383 TaxID=1120940 RepID=A0A495QZ06_9ACTN|nr:hypothetical protein [Actinomadura pelletieri]RKS79441.1 hypothetical protein BZB76_0907 [Actinomadura pelletieri DSM 43383]
MPPPPPSGASRRRRRAAVLGTPPDDARPERARRPLDVVTGIVLDASPHLLVVGTSGGEARLAISEATTVWHGGRGGTALLRPGRRVVVRPRDAGPGAADDGRTPARVPGGARAADRIWVDIARVTGTILACGKGTVDVDMGPHRGRTRVEIPSQSLERVLVRHPRLEPGYLIDVICVRSPDGPRAMLPGTSQPGYRVNDLAAPEHGAPVPDVLRGTATWFGGLEDRGDEGDAADGAAYPAVDAEGDAGGCGNAPSGCVAFPFLSLGSEITVHNECDGRAAAVPVVECGCVAAHYCDRCVECGASPRGRIVELTPAAFARLGGDLESGCFNTAVRPLPDRPEEQCALTRASGVGASW